MHIVVSIKQVPDTNNIKWSKENNLLREGMISIINPYDEYGISNALEIKKRYPDAKITALSMGPKQAKDVLEYALARGCDEAILLCDKKFQGSDTLSTGRILSAAIKKFIPDFDLIICGQFAIDGDTAQSGPSIAGNLEIPCASCVEEIINFDIKNTIVKQCFDDGVNVLEVKNPCLVCVLKNQKLEIPPLKVADYVRAQDIGVKILNASDIEIDENLAGIKGSPTYVFKAYRLEHKREAKEVDTDVCEFLSKLLGGGNCE